MKSIAVALALSIPVVSADDYKVVFFDDFEGTQLNPDVWGTWNNVSVLMLLRFLQLMMFRLQIKR